MGASSSSSLVPGGVPSADGTGAAKGAAPTGGAFARGGTLLATLRAGAVSRRRRGPLPGGAVSPQHDSQKHSYASWKFGTSTRNDQAKVYVSQEHAKSVTEYIESPGPAVYGHRGGLGSVAMGTPDSMPNPASHLAVGAAAGPAALATPFQRGRAH